MSTGKATVTFFETYPLDETSIRLVQGITGLYFIYLETLPIPYPFKTSRLIYIGMSESRQNSIGNRLRDHKSGQSGNLAVANYARHHKVRFTYLGSDFLQALGERKIQESESLFLQDFMDHHGAYPICNNQSGISFSEAHVAKAAISVDWGFFDQRENPATGTAT